MTSWMFGFDSVGRLAGPIAGGFLATALGVRAPFAAYGVMALLALVPVLLFIRDVDDRETTPLASSGAESAERSRTLAPVVGHARLTVKEIILPRLSYFAVAFGSAVARGPVFAGLFLLYAAFTYGLQPKGIGLLATTGSALALPIGFMTGWMMDRYGRRRTLIPGFIAIAFTLLLVAATAVLHSPLVWFVATYMAVVATQSLTSGSNQTLGADVAPPGARGVFLGLWNFTGQGGSSLSPIVFAALAAFVGYPAAFVFLSIAALSVAAMLATLIPETGRPVAQPAAPG
jgi:MFS family permease